MRWTGCAMMVAGLLLAGGAAAQENGGNRGAAVGRTPAGRSAMPPLQTEPGDIWADVRSWDGARRRPVTPAEPPRQPPRRRPRAAPAGP